MSPIPKSSERPGESTSERGLEDGLMSPIPKSSERPGGNTSERGLEDVANTQVIASRPI